MTVNFGVDKITCEMKISIELKIFRNESIQKSKYHYDGRLLGLLLPFGSSIQFLAYRGVVYISNKTKHLNILIGEKFSLNFYNCKGIFDFS